MEICVRGFVAKSISMLAALDFGFQREPLNRALKELSEVTPLGWVLEYECLHVSVKGLDAMESPQPKAYKKFTFFFIGIQGITEGYSH